MQGGGDRDLHAELAGRMPLSLADAFDLRRMQAVDLPSPLVLPLLKHPAGDVEGLAEDVLQLVLACDLTGDVADGAAEVGPQGAERLVGALELFCMGIALMPDQGELAEPVPLPTLLPGGVRTSPSRLPATASPSFSPEDDS